MRSMLKARKKDPQHHSPELFIAIGILTRVSVSNENTLKQTNSNNFNVKKIAMQILWIF